MGGTTPAEPSIVDRALLALESPYLSIGGAILGMVIGVTLLVTGYSDPFLSDGRRPLVCGVGLVLLTASLGYLVVKML